jgi:hypothetical protein
MTAVRPAVTSVRNWNRSLEVSEGSFVAANLPLAGFSIIEADNIEEVVDLVSNTPCARAQGVIEIRPFWSGDADGA